ncbi:MAG: phosphoribosylglycinamide synthetase C domain-containing protein, partial [Bacillota bacterium]|nr:phosphoribosylglycinamide synthetase C domain-containing protein [Bacillota bacterium]
DGNTILPMQPARDHKRLLDGDKGPNTGGMGAVSGPTILPEAVASRFKTDVADRFMAGIKDAGIDFRGVLFVGVMYKPNGDLYVLEFNTRFGDPETEVVLPGIKGSLYNILEATADGRLAQVSLHLTGMYHAVVILAAGEYPYSKTVPVEISIDRVSEQTKECSTCRSTNHGESGDILHCGTSHDHAGRLLATGGRVLACLGSGDSLDEALDSAYANVKKVHFEGMRYRKDIGRTI